MVQVLVTENISPLNKEKVDFLSKKIPSAMTNEANKFHRWQDAQAFLLGRFLLIEGLKNYGFNKEVLNNIEYTRYNRPFLPLNIDFNLSHSGIYVACAISTACKVGIDIEEIRNIDIDGFEEQFTAEELSRIHKASDQYSEFFKYWTIKEAVIKADGRGLSFPLKDIMFDRYASVEGKKWHVHKIDIAPKYMAHVASDMVFDHGVDLKRISLQECM